MKIAIMGAGALGGTFGALLAGAGFQVIMVDVDEAKVEAIQKNGIVLHMPDGSKKTVMVEATTDPEQIGVVDLVQISVKSYHTEAAAKLARPLVGAGTYVVSVQNGLGNLEVIAQQLGKSRVVGGVTAHSAMPLSLNEIRYVGGLGGLWIGRYDGTDDPRLREIARAFTDAGFKTDVISGDIRVPIWRKLLANVSCNPVAAITGFTGTQLMECEETNRLIRKLAIETAEVAKALGLQFDELENPGDFAITAVSQVRDNKISMLQDIEAGRRTEIDYLNGAVVSEGKRLGIKTLYNETLCHLVKALEQKILWQKEKARRA